MLVAAYADVLGGDVEDYRSETNWWDCVEDQDASVRQLLCRDQRVVVEAVVGVEHVESKEEREEHDTVCNFELGDLFGLFLSFFVQYSVEEHHPYKNNVDNEHQNKNHWKKWAMLCYIYLTMFSFSTVIG